MLEELLKKILNEYYLIDVIKIEKSIESTIGNVHIVYTKEKKYILKIYEDLSHVTSMILLHDDLINKINIPKVIKNKKNSGYSILEDNKYVVLYSFLDGVQIGKEFNKLSNDIVKQLATEIRYLHNLTSNKNKYNLKEIPFCKNKTDRKSLLHFDLTKNNIFFNKENNKIGFIDFDDAKYGPSICDIAITICLLFISKKRGIDTEGVKLFIDSYYNNDNDLKEEEIKYINEFVTNWVDYVLKENEFDTSLRDSFEFKKIQIQKYM